MILSSFLGIFIYNNIITTELQRLFSNFAAEKKIAESSAKSN